MKLVLALLAASLLVTVRAADSAGAYPPLKYKPLCSHGQALVDMEMARHPELKLITVHITPLGVPAMISIALVPVASSAAISL